MESLKLKLKQNTRIKAIRRLGASLIAFWVSFLAIAPLSMTSVGAETVAENKIPELLVQNQSGRLITRVTGLEVSPAEDGLRLILNTVAGSQKLVPLILPEGNNLIIDILDATLAFRIRNGVSKTNPAPGIKEVNLIKIDDNSIRLTITGEDRAPRAEIVPSSQNLVLSVTHQRATTEQTPDEEIEVIATGEAEDDNYLVPEGTTATKTDIPLQDTPASIQVIPEQVIEEMNWQITLVGLLPSRDMVDWLPRVIICGDFP